MSEIEPLFVQYMDTEPVQVDPNGCRDIADFIEKSMKKFSPLLDEFPLNKLNLHLYTAKLRPGLKISELVKPPYVYTPLLIRYADALPVIKKTKTFHPSEERRERWEELNPILIHAKIDAAETDVKKNLKESSLLNSSHISPLYDHIIREYSQTVREVPQETIELMHNYLDILTRRFGWIITRKVRMIKSKGMWIL